MIRIILVFCLAYFSVSAQTKYIQNSNLIDSLLKSKPEWFGKINSDLKKYKIQIIYTQINRDKNNHPSFIHHYYKLDSSAYFYCASLVKLPCSIFALEKVHKLKDKGISKESIMFTDSLSQCQKKVWTDTSSASKFPSVANYIKRMLLVSDNLAYGRIYEFDTPDFLHKRLKECGMPNVRIIQRFDGGCSGIKNVTCNRIRFLDDQFNLIFQQEQSVSKPMEQHPLGTVKVGTSHINNKGKKIKEPKDFSSMNYMSLWDVHRILQQLIFMPYLPEKQRYLISNDDRNFLLLHLSMLPKESTYPKYNSTEYFDSYKKYFIYGNSRQAIKDTNLRIFNIVGQSFGFMVDCAYIVNFKNNTEFMLSAVIYANEDEVMNDGKYEYKTVALPYLSNLGKLFLNYEYGLKKQKKADLKEFKFNYQLPNG